MSIVCIEAVADEDGIDRSHSLPLVRVIMGYLAVVNTQKSQLLAAIHQRNQQIPSVLVEGNFLDANASKSLIEPPFNAGTYCSVAHHLARVVVPRSVVIFNQKKPSLANPVEKMKKEKCVTTCCTSKRDVIVCNVQKRVGMSQFAA